ncbi:MAG: N-acetylmuramoyl-L-alanine amidase [Nocardioidaceae bacterium]|nr:N-acetylmuramoyl-L-alanine amidase [Nocardioidaceae bacterium]
MNISDRPSPRSPMPTPQMGRRRVLGLAAVAAAAPSIALVPDLGNLAFGAPGRAAGRLTLRPDSDGITSALDVPIGHPTGRAMTNGPVRSAVMGTSEFSALGVTWASGKGKVRVRTRHVHGGWTEWRTLKPLHDLPDRNTEEAAATPHGTALAWVGRSDAVQVEIDGSQTAPVLSLIDPGETPTPKVPSFKGRAATPKTTDTGKKQLPVPPLFGRKDWHPNPKFMNGPIHRVSTVKQIHVHHSDNANDYTWDDVPAMLRAIYRYHTQTLGWADIAYNFLVDKFGRIWTGRTGSVGKMARGAHTLGFNNTSVGVCAIGNYQTAQSNDKIHRAIARVAAWKLSHWDRNPKGMIWVTSTGSDKFRAGERAHLPVIDGHRNTNDTDCPGQHLYAHLNTIRGHTAHRMGTVK